MEKLQGLDFTKHHMLDELGFSDDIAKAYAPSSEEELNIVLKELDIQSTDSILDYGSGKGAAMVTMSKFDFSLIAGVELSERLTKICRNNFTILGIKNTEIFHCNASEYKDLERYSHFYLFNPFPEAVLKVVLQNIQESFQKKPRKITIIYNCPRLRDLITDHPLFEEIKEIKGKEWNTVIFSILL